MAASELFVDRDARVLRRVIDCADEGEAAKRQEMEQATANRASLHPEAFLAVTSIDVDGSRVRVTYGAAGTLLTAYLDEWFGEYMAEEDFALELACRLADCARAVRTPLRFSLGEVWLEEDGAVRLVRPPDEPLMEREALRSMADLLYQLLTRQTPCTPEDLLACHQVNREISSSAEGLVRRCAQGVESGGFGSLASFRQAAGEVLRARGKEPAGRTMRDFRAHRERVEYEASIRTSLAAEVAHLSSLRASPAHAPLERALRRIFGDPEKQGLRPLWIPFVIGYLALLAPFLMLRLALQQVAVIAVGLLFLYVGVFVGIWASYRRHRE